MKTIYVTILVVLTIAFAKAQQADSASTKNNIQTIVIKTSAVCEMCKDRIEKAMAYEKGVKSSSLVVDTKLLTVTFDTRKTSIDKIKKSVSQAGYDADEILADPKAYENLDACCKKDVPH
jgi:periplasmic mercuric ion binding protein